MPNLATRYIGGCCLLECAFHVAATQIDLAGVALEAGTLKKPAFSFTTTPFSSFLLIS